MKYWLQFKHFYPRKFIWKCLPENVAILSWPGCVHSEYASLIPSSGKTSRVSCQKGPTRHAHAWQIGPFWQDTLDIYVVRWWSICVPLYLWNLIKCICKYMTYFWFCFVGEFESMELHHRKVKSLSYIVMTWKPFLHYWTFVRGINQPTVY